MQENYFTRETLSAALKAKGITSNEEAQKVVDAMVKRGAIIQGYNEPKTTLDNTKDVAIGAVKGAGRTVLDVGQNLQTIGQGTMLAMGIPAEQVAKTGFDSLDANSPTGKAVEENLAPTNDMQRYGGYAETGAEFLAGGGAGLIKDAVVGGSKLVAKGAAPLINKAKGVVVKANQTISPTVENAVANTEKGIMDVVENSKSLVKDFAKREGTGKNPVKMIAENPDYAIKINPDSKTIDAADAISNMSRDISAFSKVRDQLLSTADETLPPIKTNDILNKTLEVFSNKNYSTYLDEGEKAVAGIVKKLKTLQKYNPETVSRTTLNDVRKGLDDTINSFTDTKLQDKVRLDLRKVFQTTLEDSIPESGLLKNLNAQIGDIIDASEFSAKRLNGTKVKGGGLTDLAMKTTGVATGAALGGGVVGGVPGAITGYMLSNFISKQLIKNAVNNPFDRKVLEGLRQQVPDIVKQAEAFIAKSKMKPTVVK
jgi:hypothetical protein